MKKRKVKKAKDKEQAAKMLQAHTMPEIKSLRKISEAKIVSIEKALRLHKRQCTQTGRYLGRTYECVRKTLVPTKHNFCLEETPYAQLSVAMLVQRPSYV